jgi:hypothetical protein
MGTAQTKYGGVHIYCSFMYLDQSRAELFVYQKQPCVVQKEQQGSLYYMAPELLNVGQR